MEDCKTDYCKGFESRSNKFGEKYYVCTYCSFRTNTNRQIQGHVNAEHLKVLLRCNRCPKAFYKLHQLATHLKTDHSTQALKCTFKKCLFKSHLADKMVDHYSQKHNTTKVPKEHRPIDPSIPPEICISRQGSQDPAKRKQIQHKNPNHIRYLKEATLTKDANGKIIKMKCFCEREFVKDYLYFRHYVAHHTSTTYACPDCDYKNRKEDKLVLHMKKEHDRKIEPCVVPGCSYKCLNPNKMMAI